jgi:hypothetical protein
MLPHSSIWLCASVHSTVQKDKLKNAANTKYSTKPKLKSAANIKYSTYSTCSCRARPCTRMGCVSSVPECNSLLLFKFVFLFLFGPSLPSPRIPPPSLSPPPLLLDFPRPLGNALALFNLAKRERESPKIWKTIAPRLIGY